jgi:hypothetical protein
MNNKSDEFRDKVGMAIGEASMLWSEVPGGVFESVKAIKVVDDIVTLHNKEITLLKAELIEQKKHQDEECDNLLKRWREDCDLLRQIIEKQKLALMHIEGGDDNGDCEIARQCLKEVEEMK